MPATLPAWQFLQGENVKMASFIETSQVVTVLALLPLILLCLLVIEAFERSPRASGNELATGEAERTRPAPGAELA